MNSTIKRILIKYSAAIAVGAGLVLLFLYLNEYGTMADPVSKYKALADAFTIPGISFLMVGCLVYASSDGFFDTISYGLGKLARSLVPFSQKKDETFYDYKKRKSENRLSGYSFLFFTGLLFMAVAAVFMILFFKVYK